MADVEEIFCIKMYLTPGKYLLLADVDKYSFTNAVVTQPTQRLCLKSHRQS